MDKENKYYNTIAGLITNHKKFVGLESMLQDIIDDVYLHSEVILNTIQDENVISVYLEKVVTTSILTFAKQMHITSKSDKKVGCLESTADISVEKNIENHSDEDNAINLANPVSSDIIVSESDFASEGCCENNESCMNSNDDKIINDSAKVVSIMSDIPDNPINDAANCEKIELQNVDDELNVNYVDIPDNSDTNEDDAQEMELSVESMVSVEADDVIELPNVDDGLDNTCVDIQENAEINEVDNQVMELSVEPMVSIEADDVIELPNVDDELDNTCVNIQENAEINEVDNQIMELSVEPMVSVDADNGIELPNVMDGLDNTYVDLQENTEVNDVDSQELELCVEPLVNLEPDEDVTLTSIDDESSATSTHMHENIKFDNGLERETDLDIKQPENVEASNDITNNCDLIDLNDNKIIDIVESPEILDIEDNQADLSLSLPENINISVSSEESLCLEQGASEDVLTALPIEETLDISTEVSSNDVDESIIQNNSDDIAFTDEQLLEPAEQGDEANNILLDVQNNQNDELVSDEHIVELNIEHNIDDISIINDSEDSITEALINNDDSLSVNLADSLAVLDLLDAEDETIIDIDGSNILGVNSQGLDNIDFSKFDYTPDADNSSMSYDIDVIIEDLKKLEKEHPNLNVLKIYEMKYKDNLLISEIAGKLAISEDNVVSTLNEIVAVI